MPRSNSSRSVPALLLMACSQRKTIGLARGPAWDLYDGQLFRILKNLFRQLPMSKSGLRILIVSARHGIVRPGQVIETYDERITREMSAERRARWAKQLRREVFGRRFRAVHVNLGRDYLRALPNLCEVLPDTAIDWASGGIGVRNSQTRRWVLRHLSGGSARSVSHRS